MQPFLSLADGGVFELTQTDEDIPWADTLEALSTAEQVLAKMLDTINGLSIILLSCVYETITNSLVIISHVLAIVHPLISVSIFCY